MKKLVFTTLIILSTGCSLHTPVPTSGMKTIPFKTENSICIDGIFANMRANGCSDIYGVPVEGAEGEFVYRCDDTSARQVTYNTRTFYVVTRNSPRYGESFTSEGLDLCYDTNATVFVRKTN